MFPLVQGGPVVPVKLFEALEEERLVFLCGAGISYYTGLPTFDGLAKAIFARVSRNQHMDAALKDAFDRQRWDSFIGLLENTYGQPLVRKEMTSILTRPFDSSRLHLHRALLDLSLLKSRGCRIVTTNFDRRFLECEPGLDFTCAPLMPIPKQAKWSSAVFIHGLLDESKDPNSQHIVMTAAYFGMAYLTDGWAARFITQLFREFTVVFVGYSIADPVMFYLLNALAAERQAGAHFREAYAFASFDGSSREDEEREKLLWRAKGVLPVLYDNKDGHRLLSETFVEWARQFKAGFLSKKQTIAEASNFKPTGPDDPVAQKVIWSLVDDTGHASWIFAHLDPLPPFEWWINALETITVETKLAGHKKIKLSEWSQYSMLSPNKETVPVNGCLVTFDDVSTGFLHLHPVTANLIEWLSTFLLDPRLLDWFLGKGSKLHPQVVFSFRHQIERLSSTALSPEEKTLLKVWTILCSRQFQNQPSLSTYHWRDVEMQTGIALLENSFREKLEHLSPVLEIKPNRLKGFYEPNQLRCYIESNVTLNYLRANVSYFEGFDLSAISDAQLSMVADEVTTLLKNAMDLFALVDEATSEHDQSRIYLPSITKHQQNKFTRKWVTLIEIVRDCLDALITVSVSCATVLVNRWTQIDYPVFQRLILNAITEHESLDTSVAIETLLHGICMWSFDTKREVLRFFRKAGHRIAAKDMTLIEQRLFVGPPREIFNEGFDNEAFADVVEQETWLRLSKLKVGGAPLSPRACAWLEKCNEERNWKQSEDHQEEFSAWSYSGRGSAVGDTIRQRDLNGLSIPEIADLLWTSPREVTSAWCKIIRQFPKRASRVLGLVAKRGSIDDYLMFLTFRTLGDHSNSDRWRSIWFAFADVCESAADDFFSNGSQYIASWLKDSTIVLTKEEGARFIRVWDRLVGHAIETTKNSNEDPIDAALNNPAGCLAEALVAMMFRYELQKGDGFPPGFPSRFELLIHSASESAQHARAILAMNLQYFYLIDHVWTSAHLLPLMEWTNSEASMLWRSYLWSPRWYPDLLDAYKAPFLKSFEHSDQLDRDYKTLCVLFAAMVSLAGEQFTDSEIGDVVSGLSDADLVEIARTLKQQLSGAEHKAHNMWSKSIHEAVSRIFRLSQDRISADLSEQLALIVLNSREKSTEAFVEISPMLKKIGSYREIFDFISKATETEISSETCVQLLYIVIDFDAHPARLRGLKATLEHIGSLHPHILENQTFKTLNRLAESATDQ